MTTVISPPKPINVRLVVFALIVCIIGAIAATILGFWIGSNRMVMPTDNSPEAGFARDMSVHHSNAVDMAIILRDRTEDMEMRYIALDIALTQQAQIGMMQGWLDVWGLPVSSMRPHMTWMGMPVEDLMPGMATSEEMNQLRALQGVQADIVFLNLMIRHHQSGIDMARAVLEKTQRPEVIILAQSIIASQESEIKNMRNLLARKGSEPSNGSNDMPDMPGMQHGGDGN